MYTCPQKELKSIVHVLPNLHRRNYVLSFKTQSLWDMIGRELNEIRPTAVGKVLSTTGHFMTNPGASN